MDSLTCAPTISLLSAILLTIRTLLSPLLTTLCRLWSLVCLLPAWLLVSRVLASLRSYRCLLRCLMLMLCLRVHSLVGYSGLGTILSVDVLPFWHAFVTHGILRSAASISVISLLVCWCLIISDISLNICPSDLLTSSFRVIIVDFLIHILPIRLIKSFIFLSLIFPPTMTPTMLRFPFALSFKQLTSHKLLFLSDLLLCFGLGVTIILSWLFTLLHKLFIYTQFVSDYVLRFIILPVLVLVKFLIILNLRLLTF